MHKAHYFIGLFSFGSVLVDTGADGLPVWLWRGVVAFCLAIIAWFIKKRVDDTDEQNKKRDKELERLVTLTAAHDVMYQVWLEEISGGGPHPSDGRRSTDRLYRLITQIAESTTNSNENRE